MNGSLSNQKPQNKHQDFLLTADMFDKHVRIEKWNELLTERVSELEISPLARDDFNFKWQHYKLGTLELNIFDAPPQKVFHSASQAASRTEIDYDLLYMKRGNGTVQHCGKTLQVKQGDFVLLDNTKPYDSSYSESSLCLATHIDDHWLRRWVANPVDIVATPIAANHGWAYPMAAILDTILSGGLNDTIVSRNTIADQFGSFLAMLSAGNKPVSASRYSEKLTQQLLEDIRNRLHEVDLSPERVAAKAGISKRHLHGLFAKEGTTFGTALLNARMGCAARILRQAQHGKTPISDIAALVGFSDPSHFARRFKQYHGITPNAYRKDFDLRESRLGT